MDGGRASLSCATQASLLLATLTLSVDGVHGVMHGPQPRQSSSDAPLPWDRGKYGLADALAVAPLYSDTPPPWDRGKHLVWSTHPLGTVFLFFSLLCGVLRLLSTAFLRACHSLLFPTMGAAWVAGGWGTNLEIGRTSVTGSGRWEWLPPNLVAPRVVKPLRLVGVYILGE